jgi:glyoxylase-like metal-dependent hydrolase (beta-lactamase superfamily II)
MQEPAMNDIKRVFEDTFALPAWAPLPGLGVLSVNAFLINAADPVLVDTGLGALREDFMQRLRGLIDPEALRWIWITHADADHVGNLHAVLQAAPNARIVTTYLGMGKLALQNFPPERCYLLNPGQELDAGDRRLLAVTPPTYDAPETTGLLDKKTGALFTADTFGALLRQPCEQTTDVAPDELRQGMVGWATVDAPWLSLAKKDAFLDSLKQFLALRPSRILSSHLPEVEPAQYDLLFDTVAAAPDAPSFVGPDQAAIEAMMTAA